MSCPTCNVVPAVKNSSLAVFGVVVMTLVLAGCGAESKPEEAYVPVTAHDIDQLSRRVFALEAHMRQTQTLLVQAQADRNELRTRLEVIEARVKSTPAPTATKAAPH